MINRLKSWMPTRLGSRLGWIGVDFGAATVKLAEVQQSGDGFALARTLVAPREAVLTKDCWNEAPLLPRLARARLRSRTGFFDPCAAAALSMSAVELRTLSLPQAGDDELESLIAQELGIEADSFNPRRFEWWKRPSASDEVSVFSVSAAEDLTKRVGQSLAENGVVPRVLDSVPHALARAVGLVWDTETPIGVLDWGHSNATFLVVHQGQPVFVRGLRSCGLMHWHEAVGRAFDISAEEADILLRERGVPDESQGRDDEIESMLADVVRPLTMHLTGELRRTVTYLRNEAMHLGPVRLVLFGGGATLPGAVAALESQLQIPASVWEMPDLHGDFTGLGPLVGVAVGLSLLGLPDEGGG